ncbi:hypothetical protein RFI_33274, partial [Reticulomyxa filosa]
QQQQQQQQPKSIINNNIPLTNSDVKQTKQISITSQEQKTENNEEKKDLNQLLTFKVIDICGNKTKNKTKKSSTESQWFEMILSSDLALLSLDSSSNETNTMPQLEKEIPIRTQLQEDTVKEKRYDQYEICDVKMFSKKCYDNIQKEFKNLYPNWQEYLKVLSKKLIVYAIKKRTTKHWDRRSGENRQQ